MLASVLCGFVLAVGAPWIHRTAPRISAWLLAALPAALAVYFFRLLAGASTGTIAEESFPWLPARGIHLAFRADGLSALFASIISAVGTLIVVYSGAYLKGHRHQGRFFVYILSFMASMLGLALANDLLVLFVFWELTSLTSYLLIGFEHDSAAARKAARQSLLVTGGGGLALLAGFVLLGQAAGTYRISELLTQGDELRRHGNYLPILVLVLAGACTKSAQFPFHFWLPNAMKAPTPVSAYLHSATMVKVGVYLLARLSPALSGTSVWFWSLCGIGGFTMLLGASMALGQSDLKRLLAYATISVLGTLVFLLGYGSSTAIEAAMVLLLAHAAYKGALFLMAGTLDHEAGSRDLTALSGLRRAMPVTAAAGMAAALSMIGLPPFAGFLSKELLYEAVEFSLDGFALGATVLTKALLVAVAMYAGFRPFWGKQRAPEHPHEAPWSMWIAPALLAVLGLALGVAAGPVSAAVGAAVAAVTAEPAQVELKLWHGVNAPLIASIVSLVLGATLLFFRNGLLRLLRPLQSLGSWGPDRAYGAGMSGLDWTARLVTRTLQSGYLRYYVLILVATTVALTSFAFAHEGGLRLPLATPDVRFHELAIAGIILAAAVTTASVRSRLAAVAALGAVGYGVALLFVLFGAPDLAITQFSIETLTVILFLSVVYRLPPFVRLATRRTRLRDALVAGSAGLLVTVLILAVTANPAESRVSSWFAEHSYPLAHGRNVVNVILVDFRALDTLGEITVLMIGAVGVFALTKLRPSEEKAREEETG